MHLLRSIDQQKKQSKCTRCYCAPLEGQSFNLGKEFIEAVGDRNGITAKFERLTGWRPRVGVRQGVERLLSWLAGARTPQLGAAAASKVAS